MKRTVHRGRVPVKKQTRTFRNGVVLEPFNVADTWFYARKSRLDIIYEVGRAQGAFERTVEVRIPIRHLVEALETVGFTVKPPRKARR